MNAIHHKAECSDCGRKVLVIMLSIGTPHQFVDHVTCGECLAKKGIDEEWAKANPKEAEELEIWLHSSDKVQNTNGTRTPASIVRNQDE